MLVVLVFLKFAHAAHVQIVGGEVASLMSVGKFLIDEGL